MNKFYKVEIHLNKRGNGEFIVCESIKRDLESVSEYLKSKGFRKHKLTENQIEEITRWGETKAKSTKSDAFIRVFETDRNFERN